MTDEESKVFAAEVREAIAESKAFCAELDARSEKRAREIVAEMNRRRYPGGLDASKGEVAPPWLLLALMVTAAILLWFTA